MGKKGDPHLKVVVLGFQLRVGIFSTEDGK